MFERQDPQLRGKGYALSAGVAHLWADPPDIVVIVEKFVLSTRQIKRHIADWRPAWRGVGAVRVAPTIK